MSVLLVTAHMETPVVVRHPLHFDALLASSVIQGKNPVSRGTPAAEIVDPDLPVLKVAVRGAACYLASAWSFPPDAQRGRERFVRKKDATDIHQRQRTWHRSSGGERTYCLPVPTVETGTVSWVCVGGRQGVREVLRRVSQIGALRRQGYGMVAEWVVERLAGGDPEQALMTAEGKAARNLPAEWVEQGHTRRGPYDAPYWHPARQRQLIVAHGSDCRLHPAVQHRLGTVR